MDRLVDHWRPRPEWTAGARHVTWHLLPPVVPALRAGIAAAHGDVPGADDEPVGPHLSLAYAAAAVPAAPVRAALARLPAHPVRIRFPAVTLLELRRAARRYTWTPLATLPLG